MQYFWDHVIKSSQEIQALKNKLYADQIVLQHNLSVRRTVLSALFSAQQPDPTMPSWSSVSSFRRRLRILWVVRSDCATQRMGNRSRE